uniref:Paraneoplastic antigen Ma-like N-terminal domain-containing protein n=1 Tax=Cyprinodon variegatus TaxID=28743 RepID=A0A3Q2C7D1_CYPVA
MTKITVTMSFLLNWCQGEGVDPTHALIVKSVPKDALNEAIEGHLNAIKCLGRVKVKGRIPGRENIDADLLSRKEGGCDKESAE